ncbi:MAG: hypothetical protein AB1779_12305 [Candidatus Thermoplasmatota archaeon]
MKSEELKKEGWIKQFIACEPRLSEAVEIYKELGYEVRLEPVDLESNECMECYKKEPEKYKTIYIRK